MYVVYDAAPTWHLCMGSKGTCYWSYGVAAYRSSLIQYSILHPLRQPWLTFVSQTVSWILSSFISVFIALDVY